MLNPHNRWMNNPFRREAPLIGNEKQIETIENEENPDPRRVDTGLTYHFNALELSTFMSIAYDYQSFLFAPVIFY